MRIGRTICLLILMAAVLTTAVYAAEPNFDASSLTAKDVNCKKCHTDTPHIIHATKVDCKGCHEENGKVVVPQCTRCHDIEALHAFGKIGKLTAQSGLQCQVCHPSEAQTSGQPKLESPPAPQVTVTEKTDTVEPEPTPNPGNEAAQTPGFEALLAAVTVLAGYMARRQRWK